MFGKRRKKPEPFRSVGSSRIPTHDFTRRPGYESYRAPEYTLYGRLDEKHLKPLLDAHLEALFSGDVDDANGDFLDSIIFTPAREAVPELARQRYDHADILRRLIARRKADREDFQLLLEQRKQELAALEQAHAETCRLLANTIGKE